MVIICLWEAGLSIGNFDIFLAEVCQKVELSVGKSRTKSKLHRQLINVNFDLLKNQEYYLLMAN